MKTTTLIGLVSVNLLFWAFILLIGHIITWTQEPFTTEDGSFYPAFHWGLLTHIILFYFNALWLYPNRKKMQVPYWLVAFLSILGLAFIQSVGDYQLVHYLGIIDRVKEVFGNVADEQLWKLAILGMTIENFFIQLLYFALSFVLIFFLNNIKNQQIQQSLEKEKLKADLKFLKAQINPHFLFNGINSVYFLIDQQPAIAKSTLLKFSDLLRYQLYECQDDFIPLAKEIAHIEDYVAMEKIRRGEDIRITLEIPEAETTATITPLLFTPFIENAFKFVSNYDDGAQNQVDISIRLETHTLHFEVENTIDLYNDSKKGGIGIANVKKRLDLLYPKKHHLDIFEKNGRFIVRLSLPLNLRKQTINENT